MSKLSFIDSPFTTKVEYEAYLRGEIPLPTQAGECTDTADLELKPPGSKSKRFGVDKPSVFQTATGVRIVYQLSPGTDPDATPIVWMGGGLGGKEKAAKEFGAETPRLTAHPMLIFDRRGGGDGASDVSYDDCVGPDGVSEAEAQSRDLAALLRHLNLPPAILVGFSSGARLFGMTALRHPQLVRALVLVIITGGPIAAKTLGEMYYLRHAATATLPGGGGMSAVLQDEAFADKAMANGQVGPYMRALAPSTFAAAMRKSAQLFTDTQHEPALGLPKASLANCTLPALVMNSRGPGPGDGMHTEAATRAVAAALPNAEPPIVSSDLATWFGALLAFVKKHGKVAVDLA